LITFAINSGDHEGVKKSWMPTLNCFPALSFHRVANPRVDRSIKNWIKLQTRLGPLLEFQNRIILGRLVVSAEKTQNICQ
jgi:hypothetical protein|tara:strand:- start:45 stop:284 length:240 start_codon:yes stop_codon:yes gene_type:complete